MPVPFVVLLPWSTQIFFAIKKLYDGSTGCEKKWYALEMGDRGKRTEMKRS
jgi:hypothetical protein